MALDTLPTAATPPVLLYARLLRQLHELIAEGEGDSEEAEALADQMDGPWYAMTSNEQDRVGGLSADLYALREGQKRASMSDEQLRAWRQAAREAYARQELGDIDATLTFLRRPVPTIVPPDIIPFLQGQCWEKLGDLETALVFLQEAERRNPQHALAVLRVLQRLDRRAEVEACARRVMERPDATPEELYLAATSRLALTRTMTSAEAAPLLREVTPVLRKALDQFLADGGASQDAPGLDAALAQALGLCYERLGNVPGALAIYSEALRRHPNDGELYLARGLARFPADQAPALQDLASSVRLGVASIWPYHLLAWHALQNGVPGEALRLALIASRQPGSLLARAEVHETIAIALAELGQPQERILENFDLALALSPGNERIERNRALAAEPPGRAVRRNGGSGRRFTLPPSFSYDRSYQARDQVVEDRSERFSEQFELRISGKLVA